MSTNRTRRALLAMAGVTAGVAAVTVAPTAASADPAAQPADQNAAVERLRTALAEARAEAANSLAAAPTCRGIRDFGDSSISLPIPAVVDGGSLNCQMQNGDFNNPAAKVLQAGLRDCNGERDLAIDGDYGPQTAAAVKREQDRDGLTVNGVYDIFLTNAMEWGVYDRPGPGDDPPNLITCG